MSETAYWPLPLEETQKALRGQGPRRPPAYMHKWIGEGLIDYHGEEAVRAVFGKYPDDILTAGVIQPGFWEAPENMPASYKWAFEGTASQSGQAAGLDSGNQVISDWSQLDEFIRTVPSADNPQIYERVRQRVQNAEGRYVMARAFNFFYERLWQLRGMQNVLMDFELYPDELTRLCQALKDFALQLVEGSAEAGAHGFNVSNDLGHQTGLMMRPDSFRQILKPLHAEMAEACHRRGMDYWIHSCGEITEILPDLAEVGVDAIHPLQYGPVDWNEAARLIRGRMTAWPGIDVQHILREKTPDEVRAHVRELIDTFHIPGEGRCVVAAGNGITGSTPLENVDAFLDETFRYGLEKEG